MPQARSSRGPCHARGGGQAGSVCCLVLALISAACSLDERTLLTAEETAGSANTLGGTRAVEDPASGGAGGEAPLPHCVYSGSTVAEGCETLVKNPGFARNLADWSAENVGVSEAWVNADASSDPHSGSLVVTNLNFKMDEAAKGGVAPGGARQCLPATTGKMYDLTADVFIPKGQGMGFQGDYVSVATLSVFFYPSAGCDGQTIANFTSDAVQVSDEWVHVQGSTTAPRDTQAMAVRLATLKPFRQYQFEAHFDNVFVRER